MEEMRTKRKAEEYMIRHYTKKPEFAKEKHGTQKKRIRWGSVYHAPGGGSPIF